MKELLIYCGFGTNFIIKYTHNSPKYRHFKRMNLKSNKTFEQN